MFQADWVYPVVATDFPFRIVSEFQESRPDPFGETAPRPHLGWDHAVPTGTPIVAPFDGTAKTWEHPFGGRSMAIHTGDGDSKGHGDNERVGFAHLDAYAVPAGTYVLKGQVVAYSGNSGRSQGPHVHLSTKIGSEWLDPRSVFVEDGDKPANMVHVSELGELPGSFREDGAPAGRNWGSVWPLWIAALVWWIWR